MPNWITNSVSVSGDKEQIKELFKKHFNEEGTLDFETIMPSPKTKEECPEEYICDSQKEHIMPLESREWFNWYKWNCDNWGSKWNACDGYTEENYFQFDTPWDCPRSILELLSEMYPKVKFMIEVGGEIDEPYEFWLLNGEEIYFN